MSWILFAARGTLLIAATLAYLVARKDKVHRPVAVFLVGAALANIGRIGLQWLVIIPAVVAAGGDPARGVPPAMPLAGWARVAAHADHGIQFAWSAGLALTAIWLFQSQTRCSSCGHLKLLHDSDWGCANDGEHVEAMVACRCWRKYCGLAPRWALWFPAGLCVAFTAFFAATYPETRPLHRQGYLLADMLAIVAGLVLFIDWVHQERPLRIGHTATCLLLILLLDGVSLLGPYLTPNYFAGYDRAQIVHVVLYGLLSLLQGGRLWVTR